MNAQRPVLSFAVGKSLVERLGVDCDAAAALAMHFEGGSLSIECRAPLRGFSSSSIERVARDFAQRGWLQATSGGWCCLMASFPTGVSYFLLGASAMRVLMASNSEAIAVVTLPHAPCAISAVLPAEGPIHASMERTDHEIGRVARSAVTSLTIMSPFVNLEGAQFALRMFQESKAIRKILVTRMSGTTRRALQATLQDFEDNGVSVLSYLLAVQGGYETFHAKVVIADGDLAYVGSANLTHYARHSMELGVVVSGRAARAVAALVRSVEKISRPVHQ